MAIFLVVGAGAGRASATDALPTVSITDVSASEGNAGTADSVFAVTLGVASAQQVDVAWSTQNGTAIAPTDYHEAGSTLSFAPGETTKSIVVTVNGDTTPEPDETFQVNLTSVTNATILDGVALGTIVNDDSLPTLGVGDVTVAENGGVAHVPVTLNAPAGPGGVTVNATTSDGSATSPGDYAATSIAVTIPAGQTAGDVPVPIANDAFDESTETFGVKLTSPTNAMIAHDTGTVTIDDDDHTSALTITSTTVTEPAGGAIPVDAVFTVSLLPSSGRAVSVPYHTVGVEAAAGSDFTDTSGTVTFQPGETSKTILVPVLGDAAYDPNETFRLVLDPTDDAVLGTPADGVGTIVDAAAPPTLAVADVVIGEGAGRAIVTVTLGGSVSQGPVKVDFRTVDGTGFPYARAASDYTATSGTLTFAPGEQSKAVTVAIVDDTVAEGDETFTVQLSNPVGAALARSTAVVKIVDNDTATTAPPASGTSRTTTPTAPATPPTPGVKPAAVKPLTARVLSAALAGKVNGRTRVAVRLTLNQSVTVKVVTVQRNRTLGSASFPVKYGNRTVYVLLPSAVKKGKVTLKLTVTTSKGAKKSLATSVTIA